MASRWVFVIRGISNPFEVDFISSKEDALGVVVPIPAAPVAGKIFVCALLICVYKKMATIANATLPEQFVFITKNLKKKILFEEDSSVSSIKVDIKMATLKKALLRKRLIEL
jgi:hypothetical protein